MKYKLLILCVVLSTVSFSQKIEFKIEENDLKSEHVYHVTAFDHGFVLVNPFYVQIYDTDNKLLKTKPWSSISFKELKYDLVEKKNTVYNDPSFKPIAVKKTNDRILVYVYYEPKEEPAKILEYQFTNELEFVSERRITIMDQHSGYSKNFAYASMDCFQSEESQHFILAQYTISSKKTGYKHILEYQILNFDFEIISQAKVNLPEYKTINLINEIPYSTLKSLEVLNEGDPYINLGGKLFLLNENEAIPLDLSLSRQIISYKLKQDKNKNLILIGTYLKPDEKMPTGFVVIRFDDDLNLISEHYGEFHSDFYLTPTELINKRFSFASSNKNELGLKTKGSLLYKKGAMLIDAKLNEDGSIMAVFTGSTKYGNTGSVPQNIAMLKIDKDNNIESQKVVPYEFANHQVLTKIQKFKVLFSSNSMVLFATDYPQNYDENGNYKPTLEPIPFLNSSYVTISIHFNQESDLINHSQVRLEKNNKNSNVPIIIETDNFPIPMHYIVKRILENEKWEKRLYTVEIE